MFVRLTLADVKEGEMDNALEYVKNTVMPSSMESQGYYK